MLDCGWLKLGQVLSLADANKPEFGGVLMQVNANSG